jgi:hypothetical protein
MKIEEIELFNKKGIYIIKNKINDIVYIGSTWQSFYKRFTQHLGELKSNKHKNPYLQNFANKYGNNVFLFEILEIIDVKENLLIREDHWLDVYKDKRFNINPSATGGIQFTKEILEKRKNTFIEFSKNCSLFYLKFKNKELTIDEIPKKYIKKIKSLSIINEGGFFVERKPIWNKGLNKEKHDYSYLKVPKTKTEAFYKGRKAVSEKARKKSKNVLLFDINNNFIKEFESPIDAAKWCLLNYDSLPIITNKKNKIIGINDILLCCKLKKKSYKNLIFKYK